MKKVKLPIDKLREFLKLSKFVEIGKDVKLINPILQNIKVEIIFGSCTLTKSNNNSYLSYSFETNEDDISFLMPEEKVNDICSISTNENIEISSDEKYIKITDGYYKQKLNISVSDILDYPKIAEFNEDGKIKLPKEIIDIISLASNFSGIDNLRPMFKGIYVKDNIIYSSDCSKLFVKEFNGTIADLSLTKTECDLISNFPYTFYSKSGNYNTYKFENYLYGFITPDGFSGYDYKFILNKVSGKNQISIKVQDIINFCNSTILFDKSNYGNTLFSVIEDGKVKLNYFHDETESENTLIIEGKMDESFSFDFYFSPVIFKDVFFALKSYGYEEVLISDESNSILINSSLDKKLSLIISKQIKI